jgi:hypothetical protein
MKCHFQGYLQKRSVLYIAHSLTLSPTLPERSQTPYCEWPYCEEPMRKGVDVSDPQPVTTYGPQEEALLREP